MRDLKLIPVPGLFLIGSWLVALLVLHKLPIGRHIPGLGLQADPAPGGLPPERRAQPARETPRLRSGRRRVGAAAAS